MTTRDEIERLVIDYGLECYAEGKTQIMADTKAKGAALMSAIDRVLAERDARIAELEEQQEAARLLGKIYFDIAASHFGEAEVRGRRDLELGKYTDDAARSVWLMNEKRPDWWTI